VETLADFMTRRAGRTSAEVQRRAAIDTVHRLVATGGRMLVSPNCLERSLVLCRLLSRAGARVLLVLGVRREGSALAAHAWLEVDGRSLDDSSNRGYTPFVAFRTPGPTHSGIERVVADTPPAS
jgi:hypothetical protein